MGNSESISMLLVSSPDEFTLAEENLERRSRERGSAMQAQTKSQEICMSVRPLSLMVLRGVAVWAPSLASRSEGGGGVANLGAPAPFGRLAVRLPATLGSEMLIARLWPSRPCWGGDYSSHNRQTMGVALGGCSEWRES